MKKFNNLLKDFAVDFRNMGMSLERKNKSNPFGKPRGTLKGEVTRSTAEARVANFLFKNGIEYSYEKKKIVKDYWMDGNHFKPDFYLPGFNIFIEYWGRINNEYNKRRRKYIGHRFGRRVF